MTLLARLLGLGLCLSLWLGASQVQAWGVQGHHVIANLAWAQLTPQAKAEVSRLLALEPGETLAPSPPGPMSTAVPARHAGTM